MLKGLAYNIDNPREIPIVTPHGTIVGKININIVPCE